MSRARKKKRQPWVTPAARCPQCGKRPSVRIDGQLAGVLRYLIGEFSASGPALSVKCQRCRTLYTLELKDIAAQ